MNTEPVKHSPLGTLAPWFKATMIARWSDEEERVSLLAALGIDRKHASGTAEEAVSVYENLMRDTDAYIQHLSKETGDVASTSHLARLSLWEKYGRESAEKAIEATLDSIEYNNSIAPATATSF